MPSPFLPLNGPLRLEKWPGKPGHVIVTDTFGVFQADGREACLAQMVEAFNAAHEWPSQKPKPSKIQACPSCGYPLEYDGDQKCVFCTHPRQIFENVPGLTSIKKEEPKKKESQAESLEEWM